MPAGERVEASTKSRSSERSTASSKSCRNRGATKGGPWGSSAKDILASTKDRRVAASSKCNACRSTSWRHHCRRNAAILTKQNVLQEASTSTNGCAHPLATKQSPANTTPNQGAKRRGSKISEF